MPVIHQGLFLIMRRFPDHKDALRNMFLQNKSFYTICEDYQKCESAVKYWGQSDHETALVRRLEYLEMIKDLEVEIQQRLSGKR